MRLDDSMILANQDIMLPESYTAAAEDETVLKEVRKYRTYEITDSQSQEEYKEFLQRAFKPLGIYREGFLPGASSSCYRINMQDQLVAIFRLTPVSSGSALHRIIPQASRARILEVNNIAIDDSLKGDLLIGVILKNCALLSHVKGFDFVAGIVRRQVLPVFVDFGTIPVLHEPLHILGDPAICDYITYFRTDDDQCIDYVLARSYHYFHRKVTVKNIDAHRLSLSLKAQVTP
jgi:hypothetical protein